ncbi:MAG TPA: bifunctional diguanylate cyclase/phosphodiesterase, partial [Rhizomicrobium sp.]
MLAKRPADSMTALAVAQDVERFRLAVTGAREATFDWVLAEDRIHWDGATELLTLYSDPDRFNRGEFFQNWMTEQGRAKLCTILEEISHNDATFEFEFEATSPFGSEWLEMRGVRIAGAHGRPERLVGTLRAVTERVRDAQRLHYLATRDELTGHLNRTSLRSELSRAISAAKAEVRSCAYLVASIDRLAVINDAYGFGAADEVIVAVGERLSASLRGTDVIGRTAGNKFGVIVRNCNDREISLVAERLRACVRSNVISTRAGTVSATVSLGAVCLPVSAASSQEAMLRAEEALEQARSKGRDGFAIYAKSAQRETARLRLMAIADEVVAALNENRLLFAYQPIVCAKTRKPVHHECLLRMKRCDGTLVSAGLFIPAAEQLGLVRLVDRHALEMTVAQLHAHPDLTLAVNVSGTTASDSSWLQSFLNYVRANQQVAQRIIVELTETAALHAFEESARFISNLRELGCRVAIDDFGAGFTSFRNLQMLRVDMVKIDGSYVKGLASSPDNQLFVKSLVELARNFNLQTVAEW